MLQGRRALSVVGEGEEALLTVRDVAARLGVCTATVYRLGSGRRYPRMNFVNKRPVVGAVVQWRPSCRP